MIISRLRMRCETVRGASLACAAGFGGAGRAGAGGGCDAAASSADPEGREELLDITAPAGGTGDIPFFSNGDESFEPLPAFSADKLIDRHFDIILHPFLSERKGPGLPL